VEADVYVWCYALLVVHARNEEEEEQEVVVDDAINQWHKRLEVCLHADDGYFEHLL